MYQYSQMTEELLREFPEMAEQYREEIAWIRETFSGQETQGQTVYFDRCFCGYIGQLLAAEKQNRNPLAKVFRFMENMAESQDSDVRDLLQVTVLEYLYSDSRLWHSSRKYMLPETRKLLDKVKAYLSAPM